MTTRAITPESMPAVDTLRIMRRLTLLTMERGPNDEPDLSWPEHVDLYLTGHRPLDPHTEIDPKDRRPHWNPTTIFAKFVHHIAATLGIEEKAIFDYTDEAWQRISAYAARSILSREPGGDASEADKASAKARNEACGWWPAGWREACESAIEIDDEREQSK